MPNPEISPELFERHIPFRRKIEQKGHFLSIQLEPPQVEAVEDGQREKSEEERMFEVMMSYIEDPDKRSEQWEKLFGHSQTMMNSYMDITPEGLKPIDGHKETMAVYIEQHIIRDFPESAAAILKAAWDKFGNNVRIIIAPTAEESDTPVSPEIMGILQTCDNILFAINKSKQRVVKELWHLLFRIPERVKRELEQKGFSEDKILERASLMTWGAKPSGDFLDNYLSHLIEGKARVGFLAGFKTAEKLLIPGFEADPVEIDRRLEIMERYFENASKVRYRSQDGGTDLSIDVENCEPIKNGSITKKISFSSLPINGHFCFNPNSVDGKFRVNLQIGNFSYSPEFPELKDHPIQIELKEGKVVGIESTDEESEVIAEAVRELYKALAERERESGGDPDQVYQVVEFGLQLNPDLINYFESQTPDTQITGREDFRICETSPHIGTTGSYGLPDSKGNLKYLKGVSLHIDFSANHFMEEMNMEIEYKDGRKVTVMENGKWKIFD